MAKIDYNDGEVLHASDMNALGAEVNTNTTKLSGIQNGAEANVQSDWNQTDTEEDDYIKNKPDVYTKTETDNKLTWVDLT